MENKLRMKLDNSGAHLSSFKFVRKNKESAMKLLLVASRRRQRANVITMIPVIRETCGGE